MNLVGWSSRQRPRGPMDKASAHGAGDCRFESCRGQPHCQKTHVVMFSWSASMWFNGSSCRPLALVYDVDRASGSIGMHLPSIVRCDMSIFVLCFAGLLGWQWSSLQRCLYTEHYPLVGFVSATLVLRVSVLGHHSDGQVLKACMIIAEGARSHACMDVLQQFMSTRVGTHEVKRAPTCVQPRQRGDSNPCGQSPMDF